jgi:hypothetical protein
MTELEKLKAAYNAARASAAWDALVDAPDAALRDAYAAFNAASAALREALTAALAAQEQEQTND